MGKTIPPNVLIFIAVLSTQCIWVVAGYNMVDCGSGQTISCLDKQLLILTRIQNHYEKLLAIRPRGLLSKKFYVNETCYEELNRNLDTAINDATRKIMQCYEKYEKSLGTSAHRCAENYKFHVLYVKLDFLVDREYFKCLIMIPLPEDLDDWRN